MQQDLLQQAQEGTTATDHLPLVGPTALSDSLAAEQVSQEGATAISGTSLTDSPPPEGAEAADATCAAEQTTTENTPLLVQDPQDVSHEEQDPGQVGILLLVKHSCYHPDKHSALRAVVQTAVWG